MKPIRIIAPPPAIICCALENKFALKLPVSCFSLASLCQEAMFTATAKSWLLLAVVGVVVFVVSIEAEEDDYGDDDVVRQNWS